eukprot:366569-Chlamydomonas_euryale.AAC.19
MSGRNLTGHIPGIHDAAAPSACTIDTFDLSSLNASGLPVLGLVTFRRAPAIELGGKSLDRACSL